MCSKDYSGHKNNPPVAFLLSKLVIPIGSFAKSQMRFWHSSKMLGGFNASTANTKRSRSVPGQSKQKN